MFGPGLHPGGDAVNLYNGAGVLQANVVFGVSPAGPFPTTPAIPEARDLA
jgi:hypothetical protein